VGKVFSNQFSVAAGWTRWRRGVVKVFWAKARRLHASSIPQGGRTRHTRCAERAGVARCLNDWTREAIAAASTVRPQRTRRTGRRVVRRAIPGCESRRDDPIGVSREEHAARRSFRPRHQGGVARRASAPAAQPEAARAGRRLSHSTGQSRELQRGCGAPRSGLGAKPQASSPPVICRRRGRARAAAPREGADEPAPTARPNQPAPRRRVEPAIPVVRRQRQVPTRRATRAVPLRKERPAPR